MNDKRGSSSSTRHVGIVIDHPLRDLHGLTLVAHHLVRAGHVVSLVPFYAQHLDVPLLDLDLLVLNYVRPANRAVLDRAERLGVALAVLDTEGGLLAGEGPTSPAGIAAYLHASGADSRLALYLFWGSALRDAVLAATDLPPDRAMITGCPRFDLAQEPWLDPSVAAPEARAILVNTNFPAVNSGHAVDGAVDRASLRAVGFDDAEIDRVADSTRAVMNDFCDAVANLATARPDASFILRPHPFENEQTYRHRFAGLANLRVHREGSVLDVLASSAALLHVNCTTAIEAAMCGVPAISLDYANRPEMLRYAALPSEVSWRARSQDEALTLLDDLGGLRTAHQVGATAEWLARIIPFFGPVDGQAARRAADAIAAAAEALPRPRKSGRFRELAGASGVAAALAGSLDVERARQTLRPSRRKKAFGVAEVRAELMRFATAEGVPSAQVHRHRSFLGRAMLSLAVAPA